MEDAIEDIIMDETTEHIDWDIRLEGRERQGEEAFTRGERTERDD